MFDYSRMGSGIALVYGVLIFGAIGNQVVA
jgi:hypothetical protein